VWQPIDPTTHTSFVLCGEFQHVTQLIYTLLEKKQPLPKWSRELGYRLDFDSASKGQSVRLDLFEMRGELHAWGRYARYALVTTRVEGDDDESFLYFINFHIANIYLASAPLLIVLFPE
jgi:hypothetical protein